MTRRELLARIEGRRSDKLRLAVGDSVTFADLYAKRRIKIKGDELDFIRAALMIKNTEWLIRQKTTDWHYSQGNDFFKLWLDPTMSYTGAYFAKNYTNTNLLHAQVAKCGLVADKLELQDCLSVCEWGSGWGFLGYWLATNFGCEVHSFNITSEQVDYSREKYPEGNYYLKGWQDTDKKYDRLVSIGMTEHVERKNLKKYAQKIRSTLNDDGIGLLQTIGRPNGGAMNNFIKQVFQGGYLPSLQELVKALHGAGLNVIHVENLRLDYIQTIKLWLANFDANKVEIIKQIGEYYFWWWRFYLLASIAAFQTHLAQLYQVKFEVAR